jgi:UDP-glucose 4-epimerase
VTVDLQKESNSITNNLQGSRILITGGAGFVGSFIVERLMEEDVKEIVIVDNFVRGSKFNLQKALSSNRVKIIEGDIRNRDLLNNIFKDIDYCFHMAALRITQCAAEPREAFEVMYEGTYNVAEACVNHNIKKIILASSASIYGHADVFPTSENHHPFNNRTFYGAAKAANELMLRSYKDMFGLNYIALRFFNIYGPRMDMHGKYTEVMVRWYHMIREGKQPIIFGEGKQTMDFIYVEDVACANILSLKADVSNGAFNVASGRETSLEELCQSLLKVMESNLQPEYVPLPEERKKVEVQRRLADISKAKRLINFEARIKLMEGLKELVTWLDNQTVSVA